MLININKHQMIDRFLVFILPFSVVFRRQLRRWRARDWAKVINPCDYVIKPLKEVIALSKPISYHKTSCL
jgi:hypothetical protein